MSSVDSAVERLFRRQAFGIKFGLEGIVALTQEMGIGALPFRILHVAGTNGKGSVCALLESILREAGYRTGLYTSPHLVSFHERYRVNGKVIPDARLTELAEAVEQAAEAVQRRTGRPLTFFECGTALALRHFMDCGVEVAVLETGMGGRLDATNIVMPDVSVITRISLEHAQHLGPTVAAIAREKGGIIKPGRPVVCGETAPEAEAVLRACAAGAGAPAFFARDWVSARWVSTTLEGQKVHVETGNRTYGTLRLPFLGRHQIENLATAVAAVEIFQDRTRLEVAEAAVRRGVGAAFWPGRFQVVEKTPPLIVDCAHNPGAAEVLAATLRSVFPKKKVALVAGMCSDKDLSGFFRELSGVAGRVWCVPLENERGVPAAELAALAQRQGLQAEPATLAQAVDSARGWAVENDSAACVAGSLFLAGQFFREQGITLWPD